MKIVLSALVIALLWPASAADADKFTGHLTIVGTLQYGQTSGRIRCVAGKWCVYKFTGEKGDRVSVSVKSSDGDAVLWVLDDGFNILAFNDDAGGGTNARLSLVLPGDATKIYYIVFREYNRQAADFTVSVSKDAPPSRPKDSNLLRRP